MSYDQSQQISRLVSLPQNHKIIYLICLIVFFPYNTCSIHISGVCLGLWFVKKIKKIEARLHLFNLLGKFIFAKRGIHIWRFDFFFCIKILSPCVSAHFTEPLLSENVLEISLPITSWISNNFYNKGTTSKVTAEDGSVPLAVSGIPGIKSFFLTF